MLAKNPLIQSDAWTDLANGKSELTRNGKPIGGVYSYYGRWYPQIVPADARCPTTRRNLDQHGYTSRLAAQVRVQDAVAALDADPKALDALLSSRRPTATGGSGRRSYDEGHLFKNQLV